MRYSHALLSGLAITCIAGSTAWAGCGSESHPREFRETDDYVQYEDAADESVVLTGESSYVGPTDAFYEEGTIGINGDTIDTAGGKFCNDPNAKMDVIVVDGEVVDVICYPPPTDENMTRVDQTQQGDTEVPQNANNTVIVFDRTTDGEVIQGDISVDGNNVAIYGNGADKTVVEGDIHITGNNARVRGLQVKGNVILDLNNTAVLFCVVEGNVEINNNNVTMAATDVFGDVTVKGNNAILVHNRVQGEWNIVGHEHDCDGNRSFHDDNDDFVVTASETGELLSCE